MAKIKTQALDVKNVTLSECFEDYIAKAKARNLSIKAIEIYELRFSMFQRYLEGKELNPTELNQVYFLGNSSKTPTHFPLSRTTYPESVFNFVFEML